MYFYPKDQTFGCTREACTFRTPDSVGWQTIQFRDLLKALYPQKAHVFNQ